MSRDSHRRSLTRALTGTDELAITRAANAAIRGARADEEDLARRHCLLAMAEAGASRARTACLVAVFTARPGAVIRQWSIFWDLTEFATALGRAPIDPDADSIRVQLLHLGIAAGVNTDRASRSAWACSSAMRRVALAGTSPVAAALQV